MNLYKRKDRLSDYELVNNFLKYYDENTTCVSKST